MSFLAFLPTLILFQNLGKPNKHALENSSFKAGRSTPFITLRFFNNFPDVTFHLNAGENCGMVYDNQVINSIHALTDTRL